MFGRKVDKECQEGNEERTVLFLVCPKRFVFQADFKQFFCRYNEPSYIKQVKIDILTMLADFNSAEHIVLELSEYVTEVDVEIARRAIRAIGTIAVHVPSTSEMIVSSLSNLLELDIDYVCTEAAVVMKDLVRKYPEQFQQASGAVQKCLKIVSEPDGKSALLWILGEYGLLIEDAPYLLEPMIDGFMEDIPQDCGNFVFLEEPSGAVQLEMLTATVKLFFCRPPEVQKMLGRLLQEAIQDCTHPDVRDRALLYYRLLQVSPEEARRVICAPKEVVEEFQEEMDADLKDRVFEEFNSLSTVYKQPASKFIQVSGSPFVATKMPPPPLEGEPPAGFAKPPPVNGGAAYAVDHQVPSPSETDLLGESGAGGAGGGDLLDDLFSGPPPVLEALLYLFETPYFRYFAAMAKVENDIDMFLTVRDKNLRNAKGMIKKDPKAAVCTRFMPKDQTLLFWAAARRSGQDAQAMALCRMLLDLGINVNPLDDLKQSALFYAARQGHADTIRFLISSGADTTVIDSNKETAMFYAVVHKRTAAIKALLEAGAPLEAVSTRNQTCMSLAPADVLPVLQEERIKRRRYDDAGPGPKRRRTAVEELCAWADEWPIKEPVVGKDVDFRAEDVVAVMSTEDSREYAVLRTCPAKCAARLRLSEKQLVKDHAMMMKEESWFGDFKAEDWCKHVGVLTDAADPVEGIKEVVIGNNRSHFTLPLVQTGTGSIAGYVHATYFSDEEELNIAHLKVDEEHTGQGLGGLLLEAAESHSESIGWRCRQTALTVLKANERAFKCYKRAGFRVASGSAASWQGTKTQHVWSEWNRLRKVHKSVLKISAAQ
eukprot:s1655_g2.t1